MENDSGQKQKPLPRYAGKVTKENFKKRAIAFCDVNDLPYHVINPVDNPQQWGAWKAYFKSINYLRSWMGELERCMENWDAGRREGNGLTVPALMPSDFDEDWSWDKDRLAGDAFIAKLEKRQAEEAAFRHLMKTQTAQQRAEIVRNARLGKI